MAILVVDDSRAMRLIVRRELRKAGYEEIVEAENGAEALATISNGGIDLVLSDWNMPDMNGIDLLGTLREAGVDLAFGFVTSESSDDIRARAFSTGANFIVTKPFTGSELSREIAHVFGLAAAAANDGAPTGHGAEHTVTGVLEGLLGRKVTSTDGPPPAQTDRAVGVYSNEAGTKVVYCVVDMPLAASVGAALSLIPAAEAESCGRASSLPEAMEANFYEVANVLAEFASPGAEHFILQQIGYLPSDTKVDSFDVPGAWRLTMTVHVDGYPSGQLGFVTP